MTENSVKIGDKIVFSYKTGQTTFDVGKGFWDGEHVVTESIIPVSILTAVSDFLKNNVKKKENIPCDGIEWSFYVKEST